MERDFLLPDVGEGLEDATIVEWHVREGDAVHLNEPLVTIETAKAAVELPSPFEGRVVLLNASPGDALRVGELLARVDVDGAEAAEGPPKAAPNGVAGDAPAERQPTLVGYGLRRDTRAARRGRTWVGSRPAEERIGAPAEPPPARARPLAKPPVRWLAKSLGVDLRRVPPTGPHGEVTGEDVHVAATGGGPRATSPSAPAMRATAPGQRPAPAADEPAWWPQPVPGPQPVPDPQPIRGPRRAAGDGGLEGAGAAGGLPEEIPVTGVRARIAERMSLSRSTIPEATCALWVDCERLLEVRAALQADGSIPGAELITPFALVAWVVPTALQAAPLLNASFDPQAKVIRVHRSVHLGIATSTPQGLLVPVVRDAGQRGLLDFAAELARLSHGARGGTLVPAELTGSTFTVTNYGALGLDDGNPVINAPEAAILGVGTIAPRAVAHEGAVAVRSTGKLVCAFDHRVGDGADAAGFLRRLKALVEQPELLLAAR